MNPGCQANRSIQSRESCATGRGKHRRKQKLSMGEKSFAQDSQTPCIWPQHLHPQIGAFLPPPAGDGEVLAAPAPGGDPSPNLVLLTRSQRSMPKASEPRKKLGSLLKQGIIFQAGGMADSIKHRLRALLRAAELPATASGIH